MRRFLQMFKEGLAASPHISDEVARAAFIHLVDELADTLEVDITVTAAERVRELMLSDSVGTPN